MSSRMTCRTRGLSKEVGCHQGDESTEGLNSESGSGTKQHSGADKWIRVLAPSKDRQPDPASQPSDQNLDLVGRQWVQSVLCR